VSRVGNGMRMELDQPGQTALLVAAREGDDRAFATLIGGRRGELHAHCYRMLASPDDADDAVQETLLRAWRSLASFEGRSSLRTWLFRIATNAALDLASRRARRELPVGFGPPAAHGESPGDVRTEVPWMGPYPAGRYEAGLPEATFEAHEDLELAYVAALQHLPARQRAVFLLREAIDLSAAEIAEALGTTVAAVNSSLQRARSELRFRLPPVSQAIQLSRLGEGAACDLAERYARAIETGDLEGLLELLTEDASWSMPPLAGWYSGREALAAFLGAYVLPARWRHRTTGANGQLAVAGYLAGPSGHFAPAALDVLELRGNKIASVTGFLVTDAVSPEGAAGRPAALFDRFGLPSQHGEGMEGLSGADGRNDRQTN
jgi:RNA polymerase sigma-70 factor (ECF subfamily)